MYTKIATVARGVTACLALTLGGGIAEAHDGYIVRQQGGGDGRLQYVVRYPDLNLSSIEGVSALYGRLRRAAELVCPLERDELSQRMQQQTCTNKAIGDAVSSVDSSLLTRYHQLRTKGDRAGLALLTKNQ